MRHWIVLTLVGLLFSCQHPKPPKSVTSSFYFWKTNVFFTEKERTTLQSNHVKKLYVKFFDVDWHQGPAPKAIVQLNDTTLQQFNIIPVVYITNQTMLRINPRQVDTLAKQIAQKVSQLAQKRSLSFAEIQLDCDWTISSRNAYFRLLSQLRSYVSNRTISATIRLHQIKYADKTGVPPVDRGLLMCYNMADWKKASTENSIFDTEVIGSYLGNVEDHPLPLDVALPLFRWAVIYRHNRFVAFVNHADSPLLQRLRYLTVTDKPNRFVVNADTMALGLSLHQGDVLRTEVASYNDLLVTIRMLRKRIQNQTLTFAFYHLDQPTLTFYTDEQISQLFAAIKEP
ncbi:MAG: hypothetical protein U0Y10_27040 [Spirosomataceae bacterium]